MIHAADRHPSTQHVVKYFASDPLPDRAQGVARLCEAHAVSMLIALPDGPELTAGLRKLLEAKDCFVRAALEATS